VKQEMMGVAVV